MEKYALILVEQLAFKKQKSSICKALSAIYYELFLQVCLSVLVLSYLKTGNL